MKLNANPEIVVDNLTERIAELTKENAFYHAALTEAQEKIKELEKE